MQLPLGVRVLAFLLLVWGIPLRADNVLFVGNSFTQAAGAMAVAAHGGVPKLFQAIAQAKDKTVDTTILAAGGKNWAWHLVQPGTEQMLKSKTWDWVVLQDFSSEPTHIGNVATFMQSGETFSDRIAADSPHAGVILYETWARPPVFYKNGKPFADPAEMMQELHTNYTNLGDDLAKRNASRPARVALVGTAFARLNSEYPAININAKDNHHSTAEGYYLAALVIYETIYHDSAKGAPTEFFKGAVQFPPDVAAELQTVADEVAGTPAPTTEAAK